MRLLAAATALLSLLAATTAAGAHDPCPTHGDWYTELQRAFYLLQPLHSAGWHDEVQRLLPAVQREYPALWPVAEEKLFGLLAYYEPTGSLAEQRAQLVSERGTRMPPDFPCKLRFVRLLAAFVRPVERESACGRARARALATHHLDTDAGADARVGCTPAERVHPHAGAGVHSLQWGRAFCPAAARCLDAARLQQQAQRCRPPFD